MSNQVSTEPSSKMDLYRVLEDEYINLYGPLPPEYPWLFLQSHIKDRPKLIEKIRKAETDLNKYLKRRLDEFLVKQVRKTQSRLTDPNLTDQTREFLQTQLLSKWRILRFPLTVRTTAISQLAKLNTPALTTMEQMARSFTSKRLFAGASRATS